MLKRPTPPPVAAIFFGTVFVTTLLAARWTDFSPSLWTAGIIAVTTGLSLVAIRRNHPLRRHTLVAASSLVLAHTAVIAANYQTPADHRLVDWLGEDKKSAEIEGEVLTGPIFHDRGLSFDLRLTSVDIDDRDRLTTPSPDLRLFYPTDELPACSRLPLPGDEISVWADIRRFAPADSPWRRSQRQLMEGRGYVASATAGEPLQFGDDPAPSRFRLLMRNLANHRIGLERRLADHVDGPARAIATAMLTGSRGHLTPELREPFDITSTGHVLAISGLHFAVIAGLVALVVRLFLDRFPRLYRRWPRRMLIGVVTLVILILYLLAIGAPISARRAFGMTALAIAFVCFSPWRLSALSALATTAATLLLFRPTLVLEAGFQLSICATAGILLFLRFRPDRLRPPDIPGPGTEPRHHRWWRRLLTFGGISISATLATWPVLLRLSGELPIAGLWANLIVVPLVGSVLFPLLVAGALTTGIWETAAELLLTISTDGLLALHTVLKHLAYAPGSVIRWGTPTTIEFIGITIAVGLAIIGGFRLRALLLAGLVAGLCIVPAQLVDLMAPETTEVHFIDVGQGDATLVKTPDDTTILVDGGGRPIGRDPGLTRVVPYLRHLGVDRLDAVVLSHDDYDHYGGLFATIRPFAPRVFFVDPEVTDRRVRRLCQEMSDNGASISFVRKTAVISTKNFDIRIRRPNLRDPDPNDRSLVVDFVYGGALVVLPGDLESRGERWLVDNLDGPAALVKTPHHGSTTSSTVEFIDHFSPAATIASAGRHHHFGHPDPDVVERYRRRDVDVFRTDKNGAVIATIDEDGVVTVEPTR